MVSMAFTVKARSCAFLMNNNATVNTLLQAKNISVWRGDNILIDNVSFSLSAGSVTQVLGPNGSGKTTLLRIICGIGLADEGQIFWRDNDTQSNRELFHQELLYIGHKAGISSALTPMENLSIHRGLHGSVDGGARDNGARDSGARDNGAPTSAPTPTTDEARNENKSRSTDKTVSTDLALAKDVSAMQIQQVLDELGIGDKAQVTCNKLSAGQQRRVALAKLKLQKATLWVLDEPLTSLDKAGQAWVTELLLAHVQAGGAVMFTTHTPLEVEDGLVQLLELGK